MRRTPSMLDLDEDDEEDLFDLVGLEPGPCEHVTTPTPPGNDTGHIQEVGCSFDRSPLTLPLPSCLSRFSFALTPPLPLLPFGLHLPLNLYHALLITALL